MAWYAWLSPSTHFPVAMVLLALGLPLLLPLRGLLHGRRYTVAWSLFLSIGYFCHGVVEAYSVPEARILASLEVLFTLTWFIAGIAYVRSTRPE